MTSGTDTTSTPSAGASDNASSSLPSFDEPSELSTVPPTRNGIEPAPAPLDVYHIADKETKVKYRRSMFVPDYRESMFAAEPKAANMPVLAPDSHGKEEKHEPSPRRHSATNLVSAAKTERSSRRMSDLPVFAPKGDLENSDTSSPRVSDVSSLPRRSESPEPSFRMGGRVMSMPPPRSGAVSPLTSRDISPVGFRNGAVSPITRSDSPARRTTISPLSHDPKTFAKLNSATTVQMKKQAAMRQMQGLTVNTQAPEQQKRPSTADDDEEIDEVISLSPAVRQPIRVGFRRSSRASMLASARPLEESQTLDSIVESEPKPYFGQDVNEEDLVAVNLENAFDRL